MTTNSITNTQRLTVLKHLASGKPLDVVATIVRLPRGEVLDIGSHHGYPDTLKLAWAADILEKKIHDERTVSDTRPPAAGRRIQPAPAPVPTPAPAPATTPLTKPDEIRALLNTAKAHPSKRIQRAADKVFDDLDRLRNLIAEDEEKHAARRKAEQQKAAARAEIERLEAELAAAKAKLRGTPTTSPRKTTTAAKVTTIPRGEHPCRHDGCDRIFDTPQGRSLHERMKCDHRPTAAATEATA